MIDAAALVHIRRVQLFLRRSLAKSSNCSLGGNRQGRSNAGGIIHHWRWLVTTIQALGTPRRTVCERLQARARGCATDSSTGVRGEAAYEFPRALNQDRHDECKTAEVPRPFDSVPAPD